MVYEFDLFVSKKLLEMLKAASSIVYESNYTSIFNQRICPKTCISPPWRSIFRLAGQNFEKINFMNKKKKHLTHLYN